jgi:FkbM family methyltransferase
VNLLRLARKAARILREEGIVALVRRAVTRVRTRRVDEAELVYDLLRRQRRGVMIDVGAHSGDSLWRFADAGWQIHAFEPDSTNRQILAQRFGRRSNVRIDPRAVADKPATGVTFYRSDVSTGISGLSRFHESHVVSGTVDVTTLTAYCADRGISAIDFLKIDTEGYDMFVLRGLPWDALAPDVILCEFEDTKTVPLGYTYHHLARFLEERGYRVVVSEWQPVQRYGAAHTWRRFATYPCELADVRGWGNLIATRSDALHDVLRARCGL